MLCHLAVSLPAAFILCERSLAGTRNSMVETHGSIVGRRHRHRRRRKNDTTTLHFDLVTKVFLMPRAASLLTGRALCSVACSPVTTSSLQSLLVHLIWSFLLSDHCPPCGSIQRPSIPDPTVSRFVRPR
ncbi:hypothetical protein BJ322DRAFT_1071180 [Thelephora terrestris]|uniref:Secreted protein n=1 Tax=Thelephora terrestris TaxID=56493 RepID=A0A9P6L5J6_9AGAM|nr:hypothetical protein BJ322DRAFT_1071180 [Thelephora terrestris]